MPGSSTTPGPTVARDGATVHVAFRRDDGVGTRIHPSIAAQWLAYAIPCQRFARSLTVGAHGSGPVWFATPSLQRTLTSYSLPVSRRTVSKDGRKHRVPTLAP
jgi:hypothetical protein